MFQKLFRTSQRTGPSIRKTSQSVLNKEIVVIYCEMRNTFVNSVEKGRVFSVKLS
jgi:hypothetical protein